MVGRVCPQRAVHLCIGGGALRTDAPYHRVLGSRQFLKSATDLAHLLGKSIGASGFTQTFEDCCQDGGIRFRRERKIALVIGDRECPGGEKQSQFACLQHNAHVILQHRQEYFVSQIGLKRLPVDVEE